jgi:hypothetical protein
MVFADLKECLAKLSPFLAGGSYRDRMEAQEAIGAIRALTTYICFVALLLVALTLSLCFHDYGNNRRYSVFSRHFKRYTPFR